MIHLHQIDATGVPDGSTLVTDAGRTSASSDRTWMLAPTHPSGSPPAVGVGHIAVTSDTGRLVWRDAASWKTAAVARPEAAIATNPSPASASGYASTVTFQFAGSSGVPWVTFDSTNQRLVVNQSGTYLMAWTVNIRSSSMGDNISASVRFLVNGVLYDIGPVIQDHVVGGTSGYAWLNHSQTLVWSLNAGDIVQLRFMCNGTWGDSITLPSSSDFNSMVTFAIYRLA